MKLDEFTEALNEALILRGVPERIAALNVEKLSAHLDSDTFRDMNADSSKEELNKMADELSEKLLRHLQAKAVKNAENHDGDNQNLESLNDALSRAVGGNAASGSDNGDIELSPTPRPAAAFNEDGDIELAASSRPEITLNEDGDLEFFSPPHAGTALGEDGDFEPFSPPRSKNAFNANDDIELSPSPHPTSTFNADSDSADTLSSTAGSTLEFSLPDDGLDAYAPDATMLNSMGLTKTNYEAEAIETHAPKDGSTPTLPPLPQLWENEQGRKKFKRTVIYLSPLIAVASLAYFAAWGLAFAAEVALIAALITALVAVAAAGTLATITGIIYGIVRLSSRHGEGVFEIGLGIVIAGATLLAGILIYNAALRFMPWAIKRTAYLFRLSSRLIRIRIREARGRFSEK